MNKHQNGDSAITTFRVTWHLDEARERELFETLDRAPDRVPTGLLKHLAVIGSRTKEGQRLIECLLRQSGDCPTRAIERYRHRKPMKQRTRKESDGG